MISLSYLFEFAPELKISNIRSIGITNGKYILINKNNSTEDSNHNPANEENYLKHD